MYDHYQQLLGGKGEPSTSEEVVRNQNEHLNTGGSRSRYQQMGSQETDPFERKKSREQYLPNSQMQKTGYDAFSQRRNSHGYTSIGGNKIAPPPTGSIPGYYKGNQSLPPSANPYNYSNTGYNNNYGNIQQTNSVHVRQSNQTANRIKERESRSNEQNEFREKKNLYDQQIDQLININQTAKLMQSQHQPLSTQNDIDLKIETKGKQEVYGPPSVQGIINSRREQGSLFLNNEESADDMKPMRQKPIAQTTRNAPQKQLEEEILKNLRDKSNLQKLNVPQKAEELRDLRATPQEIEFAQKYPNYSMNLLQKIKMNRIERNYFLKSKEGFTMGSAIVAAPADAKAVGKNQTSASETIELDFKQVQEFEKQNISPQRGLTPLNKTFAQNTKINYNTSSKRGNSFDFSQGQVNAEQNRMYLPSLQKKNILGNNDESGASKDISPQRDPLLAIHRGPNVWDRLYSHAFEAPKLPDRILSKLPQLEKKQNGKQAKKPFNQPIYLNEPYDHQSTQLITGQTGFQQKRNFNHSMMEDGSHLNNLGEGHYSVTQENPENIVQLQDSILRRREMEYLASQSAMRTENNEHYSQTSLPDNNNAQSHLQFIDLQKEPLQSHESSTLQSYSPSKYQPPHTLQGNHAYSGGIIMKNNSSSPFMNTLNNSLLSNQGGVGGNSGLENNGNHNQNQFQSLLKQTLLNTMPMVMKTVIEEAKQSYDIQESQKNLANQHINYNQSAPQIELNGSQILNNHSKVRNVYGPLNQTSLLNNIQSIQSQENISQFSPSTYQQIYNNTNNSPSGGIVKTEQANNNNNQEDDKQYYGNNNGNIHFQDEENGENKIEGVIEKQKKEIEQRMRQLEFLERESKNLQNMNGVNNNNNNLMANKSGGGVGGKINLENQGILDYESGKIYANKVKENPQALKITFPPQPSVQKSIFSLHRNQTRPESGGGILDNNKFQAYSNNIPTLAVNNNTNENNNSILIGGQSNDNGKKKFVQQNVKTGTFHGSNSLNSESDIMYINPRNPQEERRDNFDIETDDFDIKWYVEREKELFQSHIQSLKGQLISELTLPITNYDNQTSLPWSISECWRSEKTVLKFQSDDEQEQFNERKIGVRYFRSKKDETNEEVILGAYRIVDDLSKRILLKDVLLSTILTKENIKDINETPCPRVLSRPVIFEYEPEQFQVILQFEKFHPMNQIIELRKSVNKPYNQEQILYIFGSILRNVAQVNQYGVAHSNLILENISFCPESKRYRIQNFITAQSDQQRLPRRTSVYQILPYLAPELYSHTHQREIQHDILAQNIYTLGVSFLCIKLLMSEKERSSGSVEALIPKIEKLKLQSTISAKIILKMVEIDPMKRCLSDFSEIFHDLLDQQMEIPDESFLQTEEFQNIKANQTALIAMQQLETIAQEYYVSFQNEQSLHVYRSLLDLQKQEYGTNSQEALETIDKLWKLTYLLKDNNNAFMYSKEFFRIYKLKKLPISMYLSQQYTEAAQLKWELNLQREAMSDFEEALKIETQINGGENYEIIKGYNNMGVYYSNMNENEKAQQTLMKVISFLKNEGIEDELYHTSLINLGNILSEEDKLSEAVYYFEECFRVKIKYYQDQDPETAKLAFTIGLTYFSFQDYGKARFYFEKSVVLIQQILPSNDVEVIKYKRYLLTTLIYMEQHEECRKLVHDIKSSCRNGLNYDDREQSYQAVFEVLDFLSANDFQVESLVFAEDCLINMQRDLGMDHQLVTQMRIRIDKETQILRR